MATPQDNLRGILLMLAAMAGFALGDTGIKSLAGRVPPGQIMFILGALGTMILGGWTHLRGLSLLPAALWHPAVGLRFLAEISAGIGMVMALTYAPLSLLTTILQAAPLVLTMGAALFFGEAVGPRRWSAIAIGLLGVILVLRPGFSGFDPNALWALLAMLSLAIRDLATRAAPKSLDNLQLATFGFLALVPTGLLITAFHAPPVWPAISDQLILLATVLISVIGYYAVTAAMRVGDVSAVTPMRYSRLIFGMGIGIVIFGERPDALACLGAILIVVAGLYAAWREAHQREVS